MAPKKAVASSKPVSKSVPTSSKPTSTKDKVANKISSQKKTPTKTGTSKSLIKNGNMKTKDGAIKKVEPTKEDVAATKIQCLVRRFFAKIAFEKCKQKKEDYEEMIDNLQKQAWLEIVQRQRDEDEKQRLKEEAERKHKREELKWRKDLLEAAFDGELEQIKNIIKQAEDRVKNTSSVTGEALERVVKCYRMSLIECADANDNSALSEASAGGDPDTILFFIENGAAINSQGQFNRTPIYRASFGGHLEAVKILLEHGGHPRMLDNDGALPEQVAASPDIVRLISEWDVSKTEELLEKITKEVERRIAEENRLNQIENERIENTLQELETDYSVKQKMLQKTYEELNKRINEHDKCVVEGFQRTDVTLQAIHDAEQELLSAQKRERECREKLSNLRMELREQTVKGTDDDDRCLKCNIRELDDVLLRDVGNKIQQSGKWPLLLDSSSQAVTFLRYRDTNYLNALNPKDTEKETLRKTLLGSIRYGKSLVLDMMEVDLFEFIQIRFNDIEEKLYQHILTKEILSNEKYLSLIRPDDGPEYSKGKFTESRVQKFMFVIITKMWQPPRDHCFDTFYDIKIIVPS